MVDLGEDGDVVAMDLARQAPIPGEDILAVGLDQLLVRVVRRVDGLLLGDDHPDAAGRPGRVVGDQPIAREVVLGEVGQVRGEHRAIADGHAADPERAPEKRVVRVHDRPAAVTNAPPESSDGIVAGARPSRMAARRPSRTASRIRRGAMASPIRSTGSPAATAAR